MHADNIIHIILILFCPQIVSNAPYPWHQGSVSLIPYLLDYSYIRENYWNRWASIRHLNENHLQTGVPAGGYTSAQQFLYHSLSLRFDSTIVFLKNFSCLTILIFTFSGALSFPWIVTTCGRLLTHTEMQALVLVGVEHLLGETENLALI